MEKSLNNQMDHENDAKGDRVETDQGRRQFLKAASILPLAMIASPHSMESVIQNPHREQAFFVNAIYNHTEFRALSFEMQSSARNSAIEIFGVGPWDYNHQYQESIPAIVNPSYYFYFLSAYPYTPLPEDPIEAEEVRQTATYGWMAIVHSKSKFQELYQNFSPEFLKVFDVEFRPFAKEQLNLGETNISEKAWEESGFRAYNEQTPAMWGW